MCTACLPTISQCIPGPISGGGVGTSTGPMSGGGWYPRPGQNHDSPPWTYPPQDIPHPWTYPQHLDIPTPPENNPPPRGDLIPEIPTLIRDMGPEIPLWTDGQNDCKTAVKTLPSANFACADNDDTSKWGRQTKFAVSVRKRKTMCVVIAIMLKCEWRSAHLTFIFNFKANGPWTPKY